MLHVQGAHRDFQVQDSHRVSPQSHRVHHDAALRGDRLSLFWQHHRDQGL
ncbi:hypothetical protein Nmel_001665 [Mimus melanotis]